MFLFLFIKKNISWNNLFLYYILETLCDKSCVSSVRSGKIES